MDDATLRAMFDEQVRRRTRADTPGARAEADGQVVRQVAGDGHGWSGITWSDLAGPSDADRAIAPQARDFARLGLAGFVRDEDEAVMVADVPDVPADVTLPPGVTLRPVATEADVGLLIQVHERVFGRDKSRLHQDLLAQLHEAPQSVAMVLAMAGDEPVSSARADFPPGSEFAGLWGGGTLPAWRGRGIYRGPIAYPGGLGARPGH